MKKRLYDYISYLEKLSDIPSEKEAAKQLRENILTQIKFFQHERLIHLIVTMSVALFIVIFFVAFLISEKILLLLPTLLLLALFVPYIMHYFTLENGVQKIYTYFDKLFDCDFAYENTK